MANVVEQSSQKAQNVVAGDGSEKWDAMTEEQKKKTFDALPEEKKHNKTYYEWIKDGYNRQYENWMPWIEDQYLRWFTKDNKASYSTKSTLDKSKVTGVEQVDQLQDGVHSLVAGQVGQGGMLQPVGDAFSKEGVNRVERGGKDNQGTYGGPAASITDPVANSAKASAGTLANGAKSAGGYVGGLFGRGGGDAKETAKE